MNGTWIKHNPIPPEYGRWGSFFKLRDDNLSALREILDDLAKTDKKLDGNRAKLRDFYRTAMDEARLDELGLSPLAEELERIAKIQDRNGLVAELGRQRAGGCAALFMFYVSPDEKQSARNAIQGKGAWGCRSATITWARADDSKRIRTPIASTSPRCWNLLGDKPEEADAGADAVFNRNQDWPRLRASPSNCAIARRNTTK